MKVSIKNVGIINNSVIDIDGLTVITGQNNSGKTTVGKALYSLFSAKENLFENATRDIINYAKHEISDLLRNSNLSFFLRRYRLYDNRNKGISSRIIDIFKGEYPSFVFVDDIQSFITELSNDLETITLQDLHNWYSQDTNIVERYKNEDDFKEDIHKLITELSQLNQRIYKLSNFDDYESKKILKTLTKEFNRQISPVRLPDNHISTINLSLENEFFDVVIDNKNKDIKTSGYFGFEEINNVIFIDDLTVIDNVTESVKKYFERRRNAYYDNELTDIIFVLDHNYSLIEKLLKTNEIIESIIGSESYGKILQKISDVLADDIIFRDGDYVCSSDNLNVSNLAMGSKFFAILKMLISNGSLNSKSLLILDEPESHLHPAWQNKIAEIIVLLVKNLGAKIVITSHSPNFVLALQTFAIKYDLVKTTHFYITEKKADKYLVDYKAMNENMTEIYAEFAKPFSAMKAIYDSLKYGEVND